MSCRPPRTLTAPQVLRVVLAALSLSGCMGTPVPDTRTPEQRYADQQAAFAIAGAFRPQPMYMPTPYQAQPTYSAQVGLTPVLCQNGMVQTLC